MKIHEYQAKDLFKKYGITVPEGFLAESFEEAHEKGKSESELYAKENDFDVHSEQLVYKQDGKQLLDGYELWSELYQAPLDLESFYKEHYLKHAYIL